MNLFNYDKPKRKYKCQIDIEISEEDINEYLLENAEWDFEEDIDEEDVPTIDDLSEKEILDIVEEIGRGRIANGDYDLIIKKHQD